MGYMRKSKLSKAKQECLLEHFVAGTAFAPHRLEVADAITVVEELEAIFDAAADTPVAGLIRFMPITRLNTVLAMSPGLPAARRKASTTYLSKGSDIATVTAWSSSPRGRILATRKNPGSVVLEHRRAGEFLRRRDIHV
jgi:hypothetical protein